MSEKRINTINVDEQIKREIQIRNLQEENSILLSKCSEQIQKDSDDIDEDEFLKCFILAAKIDGLLAKQKEL
jgi:hypothetical protein